MYGNPDWGNQMQLFSETGYNLTIRTSGQILGTQDDDDSDSYLELTSAGAVAAVRIRGLTSQLYLCFNPEGNLYGESDSNNASTVFEEHFQGSYSAYRSIVNPEWFIGIKKNGVVKEGPRTGYGQKAVKFLPRRLTN